jgi:hypothetical protein
MTVVTLGLKKLENRRGGLQPLRILALRSVTRLPNPETPEDYKEQ